MSVPFCQLQSLILISASQESFGKFSHQTHNISHKHRYTEDKLEVCFLFVSLPATCGIIHTTTSATPLNPCDSSPCKNNELCVPTAKGGYTCTCLEENDPLCEGNIID